MHFLIAWPVWMQKKGRARFSKKERLNLKALIHSNDLTQHLKISYIENLRTGKRRTPHRYHRWPMKEVMTLEKKNSAQLTYGIVLLLAGLGVFYMTPQKMKEIEKIEHFSSYIPFIWFCFYFMGVMLVGGGIKKIYRNYRQVKGKDRVENSKQNSNLI
jgi:hypothetical protein